MNTKELKARVDEYLEVLKKYHGNDQVQHAKREPEDFIIWVSQQQPHDLFIERAAQILGIKPEDVTPEQRKQIRAWTFFTDFASPPK